MKNERKRLVLFWLSFCSLFSAWKIVGMTMTCNWCDVMNIRWHKTEMEQKSDRERWGDGGQKERERECVLSFGIWIHEKKEKEKNLFWIRPWERKKASNSKHPRGWMGKPEYLGGKNMNQIQCKPYDINLDEGFTAIKAQEITTKTKRERDAHIHSHTIVPAYIRTNAVLW